MSLPNNDDPLSNAPTSNWIWLWLGVCALLLVATVFGFLRAGRAFWQVSEASDASGCVQQA